LGCDSFTTVTRIAEIVTEEMNLSGIIFKYTDGRSGLVEDAPIVHFNIDKMKNLGWEPRYDSDGAVRVAARRILGKE
jgi:UDP-glucose 4-epimerase